MTLSDNFLLYAFVAAFSIIGIHASTWKDMINHWVNGLPVPYWVSFPLWDCPICMASFWGISFSVLFNIKLGLIPFFCLTIAGINTFFVVLKRIQEGDKRC